MTEKLFLIDVSSLAVGFLKSLKTYRYDSGSAECPVAIFMPPFIPKTMVIYCWGSSKQAYPLPFHISLRHRITLHPPCYGEQIDAVLGSVVHMLPNTPSLSIKQKATKYNILSLWMCLDTRMAFTCALARHNSIFFIRYS